MTTYYRQNLFYLSITTLLGFLSKYYSGPGFLWFNHYFAGLLYVVFWCLFFSLFFSSQQALRKIPWIVLFVTCCLETLQLWKPTFLQEIRATFIGAALLGDTFSWGDFPHYVLGTIVAIFLLKSLKRDHAA